MIYTLSATQARTLKINSYRYLMSPPPLLFSAINPKQIPGARYSEELQRDLG
jgi:hypothetical protein